MLLPATIAWGVTILLLSVPNLLVPVAVGAWVGAAGLLVLVGVAGLNIPMVRIALLVSAVSFAAIGMIASIAAAESDSRRPFALTTSKMIDSATLVTTQTAVPSSRFFAATITSANGQELSVPVLVFGAAPKKRTEIGTTLRLSGSLIATAPGDEVSYLVFVHGAARTVEAPAWYLGWANTLRADLASAAARMPGNGAELLPGLALGDTVAVDPALNLAMKTSSLSHLTAVSGANCAVVIGLILMVGRAIGLRRAVRLGLAFIVLVGFVVLVTPQPSVLRSAVMAAVALGIVAAGRPVNGLSVVGVAALVLLASDPWLALSYGFALSALATVGLLTLTSPITRRLEAVLPRWLSLVLAVPLAAQLACQPVLILLSPTLPPYGVLANLLAEPASPIATVVGLLACLALPILPSLGSVLVAIAWVPSSWIAAVATFFAGFPGARLPWPGGFFGSVGLAFVTVLLLAAALARMRRRARLTVGAVGMSLSAGMLVLAIAVPGIGVPAAA